MARIVADAHRPTLPDLLAPAPRAVRLAVYAAGVALVVALIASRLVPDSPPQVMVREAFPAFNFTYGERLQPREAAAGELAALEERRGDLFVQSFAVKEVPLPSLGDPPAAVLPVAAESQVDALRERFAEFELVSEGKANINQVSGYEVAFRGRQDGRLIVGKVVLLPDPSGRGAVALELLHTPVSGVTAPADVGTNAVLKPPLRSFRFGTERP